MSYAPVTHSNIEEALRVNIGPVGVNRKLNDLRQRVLMRQQVEDGMSVDHLLLAW